MTNTDRKGTQMETDPFIQKSRNLSVQRAYEDLLYIFRHADHPDYLLKDSELCTKYGISRATMRTIRGRMGVPKRSERIVNAVLQMNTQNLYLSDICEKLKGRVEYKCLHKIVEKHEIPIKKRNND
jgi:hypothetical protein